MSDPHPARTAHEKQDKRTFLQKVAEFIHPGPDSKAELIETLADAEDNDVIGPESRVMLEGVIRMAELTAGDVMVAAPRMDLIDIDAPYEELHVATFQVLAAGGPIDPAALRTVRWAPGPLIWPTRCCARPRPTAR